MDTERESFLISRIMAGYLRCHIKGKADTTLLLYPANPSDRYIANEIFLQAKEKSLLSESLSNDELLSYLIYNGLWSREKEDRLVSLPTQIENLKIQLYQLTFKSYERKKVRDALINLKEEMNTLISEKEGFFLNTQVGLASLLKHKYLILSSLYTVDGHKLFPDISVADADFMYNAICECIQDNRITDTDYRRLARSEQWKLYYNAAKGFQLFSKPAVDWSEEQLSLVCWTQFYESILEHSECPHSTVVEDDDMLDGWAILQRRKREEGQLKKEGEENISKNPKIQNAKHIFLVADTVEDAKKIDAMNDTTAKIIKAQRLAMMKKHDSVPEQNMLDSQMEMRQMMMKQSSDFIKGA